MDELREKCPWDRKQTFQTLRNLTIEETYELAEVLLEEDLEGIKEELGDLMLHLVFYAKIGEEKQAFDVADVLNTVSDKLIERHPHIYGDVEVNDEEDVKKNWEQIKLASGKKSVLQGVPKGLPALVKSYRIQEKTHQVGFGWDESSGVWKTLLEELDEFKETMDTNAPHAEKEDEFGDVLFSLVNYARYHGIEAESALERSNRKFKRRFEYVESHAAKPLDQMTPKELDDLWNECKQLE